MKVPGAAGETVAVDEDVRVGGKVDVGPPKGP